MCVTASRRSWHATLLSEGTAQRGYDNVIRELTYTLLNSLVGLKAMEVRKLLYLPPPGDPSAAPEETEVVTPVAWPGVLPTTCVTSAPREGAATSTRTTPKRRCFATALTAAFRQVTREIRVLFDPDHEYACVWPTHATLTDVLQLDQQRPAGRRVPRAGLPRVGVPVLQPRRERSGSASETKGTPRPPTSLL